MSRPHDLQAELTAAALRVRERHWGHLCSLGVPGETLANLGAVDQHAFGVVDAMQEASGLYQPGMGSAHIVMPVMSAGVLVDLVAWTTLRPEKWHLRTGHGWALNADDLENLDRWGGSPPVLHTSPLEWLRAGALGSVILDWSAPEVGMLRGHSRLDCTSRDLGKTLRETIVAAVRLPEIRITEVRNVA